MEGGGGCCLLFLGCTSFQSLSCLYVTNCCFHNHPICNLVRPGFTNRIKWHKDWVSSSAMFNPGISDKLPRRSLRASSKNWQCRRKCALSSSALPQRQTGSKQSKLCLNLCSFSTLKLSRNFDKYLTPTISFMP